jgi:hypothetical protein
MNIDWICKKILKIDQKDIDENKRLRKLEVRRDQRVKKLKRIIDESKD